MSDLVSRFTAALASLEDHDDGPMDDLLDDDIEFITPFGSEHGKPLALDRFRALMRSAVRSELVDVIDGGSAAALEFVVHGPGWQMRATDHLWSRGGRIHRFHAYFDPGEAAVASGAAASS